MPTGLAKARITREKNSIWIQPIVVICALKISQEPAGRKKDKPSEQWSISSPTCD
jgi:hypothetical protein